ncbi:hypothetical protein QWY82_01255 [Simiduia curdlanivorans]|uniref:Uncharacterized protein n=1 Tax=Simiduia curdlanivorans TaxID=1492769 RepID=A0ABV8V413_9GAMM|nr:hypothetical protein [Simiduia curdlanivorans]MDN3637423.1 hypothetical protein [Simiduia curdlanivorans]
MWRHLTSIKHLRLAFLALSLCLVFAQAIETQHDHQTFQTDCYLCQHSPALACGEEAPSLDAPATDAWQETTPYFRHHRQLEKRGKRDPPATTPVAA